MPRFHDVLCCTAAKRSLGDKNGSKHAMVYRRKLIYFVSSSRLRAAPAVKAQQARPESDAPPALAATMRPPRPRPTPSTPHRSLNAK